MPEAGGIFITNQRGWIDSWFLFRLCIKIQKQCGHNLVSVESSCITTYFPFVYFCQAQIPLLEYGASVVRMCQSCQVSNFNCRLDEAKPLVKVWGSQGEVLTPKETSKKTQQLGVLRTVAMMVIIWSFRNLATKEAAGGVWFFSDDDEKNPWEISGTTRLVVDLNGLQQKQIGVGVRALLVPGFLEEQAGFQRSCNWRSQGGGVFFFKCATLGVGSLATTKNGVRREYQGHQGPTSNYTWLESAWVVKFFKNQLNCSKLRRWRRSTRRWVAFSIAAWLGFGKPSSWRLPIFDHPTVEPGCFSGAAAYKCSAHRHSVKDETKRINWGNKCKNDKHSKLIEVLQLAQLVSYKNSMWFSVISIKRWVDPSDCQSAQAENDLKL